MIPRGEDVRCDGHVTVVGESPDASNRTTDRRFSTTNKAASDSRAVAMNKAANPPVPAIRSAPNTGVIVCGAL